LTTVPLQDRAAIALFAAEHDLPAGFADLADRLHRPLADRITVETVGRNGPLIVGLCGPQGAGKSTLVSLVAELLKHRGLATAFLSLDDLYRTRAERQALASTVHPLLMTRGVPGTHDVALGHAVLDAWAVRVPSFCRASTRPQMIALRRAKQPVSRGRSMSSFWRAGVSARGLSRRRP